MNKKEAEDYIYDSYLKAAPLLKYNSPDSLKRNPLLSREIIRELSGTPAVVVTGSKGKGSVAEMIAVILQSKFKVGLFTSPHLIDFLERFRVNDKLISEAEFTTYIEELKPRFDSIAKDLPQDKFISPIGIQTALALLYFNNNSTSFNVLECGKGAKFDDVTNVRHSYAIINSIFLEHTRELGKTIEEIACDKAHVITEDTRVVFLGSGIPEVIKIIEERANKFGTIVKIYGRDFCCQNINYSDAGMEFDVRIGNEIYPGLRIPLLGEHQTHNCALAIACCREIDQELDFDTIQKSLFKITRPGRLEIISRKPFILLDACINKESTHYVKQALDYLGIKKITLIMGIPDDKDYIGVATSMRNFCNRIILTQSQNPHYRFNPHQVDNLKKYGILSEWIENLDDALDSAKADNTPIVILGTTSLISEISRR